MSIEKIKVLSGKRFEFCADDIFLVYEAVVIFFEKDRKYTDNVEVFCKKIPISLEEFKALTSKGR